MNQAIKFCNFIILMTAPTYIENLTDWLNANKISLNVKKTELGIFKHERNKESKDYNYNFFLYSKRSS